MSHRGMQIVPIKFFFLVINTINNAHTRPIDPTINEALRIVTGCLRPTPVDNLLSFVAMEPHCL